MRKPTGRMRRKVGDYWLKEVPYKDEWRVDAAARNPRDHKTFHNWRAAEEYAEKETEDRKAAKQKDAASGGHTFKAAADSLIHECTKRAFAKQPTLCKSTLRQYRVCIERFLVPKFGAMVEFGG